MLLKYKTVMMTGGASGLGRATVLMLAKEGARRHPVRPSKRPARTRDHQGAEGGWSSYYKVELTDGAAWMPDAKKAIERLGAKDRRLVNCACWDERKPFVEADQAHPKGAGSTCWGPRRLTARAVPAMSANGAEDRVRGSDAGRVRPPRRDAVLAPRAA